MAHDLGETGLVVNLVTESRGIHNSQGYACAFLIKLQFDCDWLDPNAILDMGAVWVIVYVLALQDTLST